MTESQQLLADYVKNSSETAFRELVKRYVDLIYSTAVRLVNGDKHLAEDVTQTVFVNLASKAHTLSPNVALGGWLHRDTCFAAAKTMRGERRRQARERQVVEMNALEDHSEGNMAQVAPILDEAINRLGSTDRTAILLRFYERLDFHSVGGALECNEAAAQKRVTRALEKLHVFLKHRGVALSAAALGTVLAGEIVTAAPSGLAVTVSSVALAGTPAGAGMALTFLKIMTMTNLKLSIGALVIAGVATTFVIQRQAQEKLRVDNESLRQQITQLQSDNASLSKHFAQAERIAHLSAPPAQFAVPPAATPAEPGPGNLLTTNLISRLLKDRKAPMLTSDQVQAFLKANGTSAANLLAAFRASGDPALLQEAMEKYPNDPQVDLAAIFKPDSSPEEQRQWLNTFEQSAPNNALANYLSALNYFQSGQSDQAVQELNAASTKPQFQDYIQDSILNIQDAYLAAGYSAADAGIIAGAQVQLPQLTALKQLGQDTISLANSYQQAGNQSAAQAALQMAVNIGGNLDTSDSPFVISQLSGIGIERGAFGQMDPSTPYGDSGQTVQDQLDQLVQQRTALMNLTDQFNNLVPTLSDEDWISFDQRRSVFGNVAAEQWAVGKYSQQ